ncbi:MAG TPA: hypothetical protein VH593_23840 [Ktedonobacteraceae bacterium]
MSTRRAVVLTDVPWAILLYPLIGLLVYPRKPPSTGTKARTNNIGLISLICVTPCALYHHSETQHHLRSLYNQSFS